MGRLGRKVAIVTGTTLDMSRGTTYAFAEGGVKAVITGRGEARTKRVIEIVEKSGGKIPYVVVDLSDRQSLDQIVDEALKEYGTVDVLFSNAGLLSIKSSIDVLIEEWDKIIQVNLTVALLLSKKVAPIMKAKGQDYIINTESIAETLARWGTAAYYTSKYTMNRLIKTLAHELRPGIRVNVILPGVVSTVILDSADEEAAVGGMKETSPLKRVGQDREIGTMALFFATEDSSSVTGQFLRVDGGVDC